MTQEAATSAHIPEDNPGADSGIFNQLGNRIVGIYEAAKDSLVSKKDSAQTWVALGSTIFAASGELAGTPALAATDTPAKSGNVSSAKTWSFNKCFIASESLHVSYSAQPYADGEPVTYGQDAPAGTVNVVAQFGAKVTESELSEKCKGKKSVEWFFADGKEQLTPTTTMVGNGRQGSGKNGSASYTCPHKFDYHVDYQVTYRQGNRKKTMHDTYKKPAYDISC